MNIDSKVELIFYVFVCVTVITFCCVKKKSIGYVDTHTQPTNTLFLSV